MSMGEAIASIFAGAAGEAAGNRSADIRDEEKARLAEAREMKMMALQQKYNTSEREATQAYNSAERESTQGWQSGEKDKDRAFSREEREASQGFQAAQADKAYARQEAKAKKAQLAAQQESAAAVGSVDDLGNAIKLDGTPYKLGGQWLRAKQYSNGRIVAEPLGVTAAEKMDKRVALEKDTDGDNLMNRDVAILEKNLEKGDTAGVTGLMSYVPEGVRDLYNARVGGDTDRETYVVAKRVQGRLLSQGVADAKAMGASGINTATEAQMYFSGMPQLDFSSDAAMKRSLADVKQYTFDFNNKERKAAGLDVIEQPKRDTSGESTQRAQPTASSEYSSKSRGAGKYW